MGLDDKVIKKKDVDFIQGENLQTLIENNFDNVVFENGTLMDFEDYTTPDDYATYICVYVDLQMSSVGISSIEFVDGTIISLRITLLSDYEQ